MNADRKTLAGRLRDALKLRTPPLAIAFLKERPRDLEPHAGSIPAPLPDGRTGRVAAGCVFWKAGAAGAFYTVPEDHYNCSVGSVTHGLKSLHEVMDNDDVRAVLASGWVSEDEAAALPAVRERPGYIVYGPLAQVPVPPDVVLLHVTPLQAMTIHDAFPDATFHGKPQCHVIPLAMERRGIAFSTGCTLSRVRTGASASEMTCAIPAHRIEEVADELKRRQAVNKAVAAYAADDVKRFM